MIAECHPVGPLQANAYVLVEGGRAVIVDPGDEPERLLTAVQHHRAVLEAIWLTHADFDHVGGLAGIIEVAPVPVLLHPLDRPILASAAATASAWGLSVERPPTETAAIADGQELDLGEVGARCLFTPGHTPGHVAFYLASERMVLTGDALFRGAIGRTDRSVGDTDTLLRSIRERLLVLPPDTRVLPGHGPETTIGCELRTNPFLTSSRLPRP